MSVAVILLYLVLAAAMWVIVKIFGARAQNRRYEMREAQFNKVLHYFNKTVFHKKGVAFYSGKYGAHIWIDLKYSSKLRQARATGDWNSDLTINLGQDISQSMMVNFVKPAANRFTKKPVQDNEEPGLLPQLHDERVTGSSAVMEDFFRSSRGWRDDQMQANPELLRKIQDILAEDDKQNDFEIMQNIKVSQLVEERKEKNTEFFVGEQVKKLAGGHTQEIKKQQTTPKVEIREPLLKDVDIQENSFEEDAEDNRRRSGDLESPTDEDLNLDNQESAVDENMFTSIHTTKNGLAESPKASPPVPARTKTARSDSDEFKTVLEFVPDDQSVVEDVPTKSVQAPKSVEPTAPTASTGGKSVIDGQHAELMLLASELESIGGQSAGRRNGTFSLNDGSQSITESKEIEPEMGVVQEQPAAEDEFADEEFKSALEFMSVADTSNNQRT